MEDPMSILNKETVYGLKIPFDGNGNIEGSNENTQTQNITFEFDDGSEVPIEHLSMRFNGVTPDHAPPATNSIA
ncbi:hypothetical protein FQA39_LY12264 [Lamprigera yunnana]|nr:hypothetical protein FQA39_LY12264 [Lamprigera yunnana]